MSYPMHQGPGRYGAAPPQVTAHYVTALPHRSSTGHVVIAWILTVLTAFYLLPWAIAATRSKRNVGPIVLINIFLGWTLAGWIAALVMACLNDDRPTVMTVFQPVPYPTPGPVPSGYPVHPQPGYPALTQQPPAPSWPTSQPVSQPVSQPTAAYPEPQQPPYPASAPSGWSRSEDEPTQVIDGFAPPYGGPPHR